MPVVEVRGNLDLRKALRSFTPDLEKILKKELAIALKPVITQARGFVQSEAPMSGWAARSFSESRFPFYEASVIKAGITYSTGASRVNVKGFTSMAKIMNKSAAGAIYETAGRIGPQPWVGPKAPGTSHRVSRSNWKGAGQQFINNLDPLTSSLRGQGRLIYKAWAANQGRADGAARRAIDKATKAFNAKAEKFVFSKAA